MLALSLALGIGAAPIVGRVIEQRLAERDRPKADGSAHI
jgi:hypothetical protein